MFHPLELCCISTAPAPISLALIMRMNCSLLEVWSYQEGIIQEVRFHFFEGIFIANGSNVFLVLSQQVNQRNCNYREVLVEPVIVPTIPKSHEFSFSLWYTILLHLGLSCPLPTRCLKKVTLSWPNSLSARL